jgi:uncharacterized damage-inducible protein DinB
MQTLIEFYRHNGWANARTFDLCEQAAEGLLTDTDKGTRGTLDETIKHMVGVEEFYLAMVQGLDASSVIGSREEYFARDRSWFLRRGRELPGEYVTLLNQKDSGWLDGPLQVPWFDFPMTVHDGLIQVVGHSAQHRAQILSVLGQHGVQVPDLDYVLMLREAHSGAAI